MDKPNLDQVKVGNNHMIPGLMVVIFFLVAEMGYVSSTQNKL